MKENPTAIAIVGTAMLAISIGLIAYGIVGGFINQDVPRPHLGPTVGTSQPDRAEGGEAMLWGGLTSLAGLGFAWVSIRGLRALKK